MSARGRCQSGAETGDCCPEPIPETDVAWLLSIARAGEAPCIGLFQPFRVFDVGKIEVVERVIDVHGGGTFLMVKMIRCQWSRERNLSALASRSFLHFCNDLLGNLVSRVRIFVAV